MSIKTNIIERVCLMSFSLTKYLATINNIIKRFLPVQANSCCIKLPPLTKYPQGIDFELELVFLIVSTLPALKRTKTFRS